ncbi:hypothetical protein DD594_28380, partial [Enterobacter cloacae complex sp. 4DZ1-17B1]
RIKCIFRCGFIAKLMRLQSTNRSTDATFRVPADSKAWRHIEDTWPHFKSEPRNLPLGMAMESIHLA